MPRDAGVRPQGRRERGGRHRHRWPDGRGHWSKRGWTPVTPYDSWLDTRCSAQITRMQIQAGNAVLRATGNAPSFNHGPKILWWQEERPSEYARIAKFIQ